MKVSLNWLRELVELPPTVPALVDLLTLAGVEVEEVITTGCSIPNVVVAQIKESVQHPNADRLSVCQVDDGSGTLRQIVCGAKNYKVGDKVPLALPGAKLPGDFTIKAGKLRSVESNGMLCSAKELNLAEDADGLLILPPDAKVGAPIGDLYPGDTVLDLEITPNRPDLLSVWGIAREIRGLTGKRYQWPAWKRIETKGEKDIEVAIETTSPCYYSATLVSGVKIGRSPEWLRSKLESVGIRSINNAVDVTNYLMLAVGQPAHVFDAAKVQGTIRVRDARDGESLLALDGKTYALTAEDLVIADDSKVLAIAGVMGGEESGVTEQTRDVILELASFEPRRIRRTSRRLGLVTDSSYRFERGIDIEIVSLDGNFTGTLMAELTGAEALHPKASKNTDPRVKAYRHQEFPVVALRYARVSQLLGVSLTPERVDEILIGFGLKTFSRDSRWLAVGGQDSPAHLWDLAAADVPGSLSVSPITSHSLLGVTFSPPRTRGQGPALALGGSDGRLHLWNWQRGPGALRTIEMTEPICSAAYLADGRLATGGGDGRVRLWETDPAKLLELAKQTAGREMTEIERWRFANPR